MPSNSAEIAQLCWGINRKQQRRDEFADEIQGRPRRLERLRRTCLYQSYPRTTTAWVLTLRNSHRAGCAYLPYFICQAWLSGDEGAISMRNGGSIYVCSRATASLQLLI